MVKTYEVNNECNKKNCYNNEKLQRCLEIYNLFSFGLVLIQETWFISAQIIMHA